MELEILKQYDNFIACTLSLNTGETNTEITTPKNYINKDVTFELRFRKCQITSSVRNSTNLIEIYIKFESNNKVSVRVQSKILNFNKKYAVDESQWQWCLLYETRSLNIKRSSHIVPLCSSSLDLTFEIEPLFDKPISFSPLYENTVLIDFELQGDDGTVPIHGLALAASSPVLCRMLEGKWTETQERALKIQTSKETLQHLKDYIYLGVLPETGLESLLLLASCYMMNDLQDKCTTKLIKTIKPGNVISFLQFAHDNNLKKLSVAVLESAQKGLLNIADINITE